MVLVVLGVQVVVDCLVAVLDGHLGVALAYKLVEVLKVLVVVCMKVFLLVMYSVYLELLAVEVFLVIHFVHMKVSLVDHKRQILKVSYLFHQKMES